MKIGITKIIVTIALYSGTLLYTTDFCTAGNEYEPVVAEETVAPMTMKLGRGLVNVLTGWGELPRQLVIAVREDGVVPGIFTGLCNGVLMTVVRTGTGAVEAVFFMSSAPGDYDPLINPRFVWGHAN